MALTFTKKQFLHMLIFSSGVGILMWQIKGTFLAFIDGRTTFAVSKETFDSMILPTIVFCPVLEWDNGMINIPTVLNLADKDWFFGQFLLLNHKLNLSLFTDGYNSKEIQLKLGENFDDNGNPIMKVEEFMHSAFGLCYAMTPDQNCKIGMNEYWTIAAKFAHSGNLPMANVIFTKPEDRYGFLLPDRGRQMNFEFSVEGGSYVNVDLEKTVWNYIQSKRNCHAYSKQDSYVKCMLRKQMDCLRLIGLRKGCQCRPENMFKTQLELYNFSSWNTCTSPTELGACFYVMIIDCYFNKLATLQDWCLNPCQKEVYVGQKWKKGGFGYLAKSFNNSMVINYKYNTMDTEIHDEVWIQDEFSFIGAVGGSFGLFIGFSYTGFGTMILNKIKEK